MSDVTQYDPSGLSRRIRYALSIFLEHPDDRSRDPLKPVRTLEERQAIVAETLALLEAIWLGDEIELIRATLKAWLAADPVPRTTGELRSWLVNPVPPAIAELSAWLAAAPNPPSIAQLQAWFFADPDPANSWRVRKLATWPENSDPNNKKTSPADAPTESEKTNPQSGRRPKWLPKS